MNHGWIKQIGGGACTDCETHRIFGQDACQGFIADSMLRVGFRSVRSRTLDTDRGPMDLDVGRKA